MDTINDGYDDRYKALAHALQIGVMQKMALDQEDVHSGKISPKQPQTSPNMLRTRINMAMVETSALGRLLIGKGVCTTQEYFGAIIKQLEQEVASYEKDLTERMGMPVKLA